MKNIHNNLILVMIDFNLIDLNFYSIVMLLIIFLSIINRTQQLSLSNIFFVLLIFSTILVLVLEVLSWMFDGKSGTSALRLNIIFNIMLFALNPLVVISWINYIDYKIFNSLDRLKKHLFYIPFLFIAIVVILINIKTGWIYTISENNIYSRGPFSILYTVYLFILLFSPAVSFLKNKESLDKDVIISCFIFTFFPIVGAIFQTLFIGYLVIWNAVSLGVLGTYLILELRNISKDFLTGLANRRELVEWIKYRIRNKGSKQIFAVIMIDLDDFKSINDTYGHKEGDIALKTFSNIISPTFKKKDVIGRYGGDEFLVIIDTDYEKMVDKAIHRMHLSIDEFNNKNIKPYKLKFSAGGVLYDPKIHLDYKELMHQADQKMYKVKKSFKTLD